MPATHHVFDGHNDCLLRLDDPESFLSGRESGHLDLPRAREGNLAGGLFALFVEPSPGTTPREERRTETADRFRLDPPPQLRPSYAQEVTENLLNRLDTVLDASDEVRLAESVPEIRECMAEGVLATVLHFEGAEPIEPDLSNLDAYYDRGLRSLGLVWSRPNQFGHGVPFEFPGSPDTGPGLTDEGRELVRRCNDLGIVVDLAHLNEAGFWDVAEVSSDPLVVSHAGVHDICPSTRNLTDEQLDAVADSGGLVGITFAENAIHPDGEGDADTSIEMLVDHIEYVADRAGVDHVALGSDFDGASILDTVGDVTGLPDIFAELDARGFTSAERRNIAAENWLRVLGDTWS
jgi:membrane dipeptidase